MTWRRPEVVRAERVRSALASPIVVEGELWGAIRTGSRKRPLPAGIERRLADFTELVATAIANAETRVEVERLAAEQVALRRVAMLVAEGASPTVLFDAVAAETERALGADVEVRHDGIGGADPGGHGLVGIGDRATALGGRLKAESPLGGGTLVAAAIPIAD